jgi:undecaprenyl-diphosphatase
VTEFFHLILLAVIQGLTEFLPVSSSGHLVLTQSWLGTADGDLFVDVLLHVGTLGSILAVYRREIGRLLRFDRPALTYMGALVVGTIPAVLVGLLLRDHVEGMFTIPRVAAGGLMFTAFVLFSTRTRLLGGQRVGPWEPVAPSYTRALLIGIAQAFAILPGISRSGSTIAAGMWAGLPRAEAARFGFLLSIPAVGGALVLQIFDGGFQARGDLGTILIAMLVAFGVGLLAIRWTALAVVQAHFWKFGFYCLALGVGVLVFLGR